MKARIRKRSIRPVGILMVLLFGCGSPPDGREMMRAMQQSVASAPEAAYSFRAFGAGSLEATTARLQGSARVRRLDLSGSQFEMEVEGEIVAPGSSEPRPLHVVRGDEVVYKLSLEDSTVRRSSIYAAGSSLQAAAMPALMYAFYDPNSLDGEIEAESVVWEGRSEVEGEPCDSVRVDYADDEEDSRWCIGVDDHLPKRLEWIGGDDVTVLEIWDVVAGPVNEAAPFVLAAPQGFEVVEQASGPPLGSPAAPWTLPTPSGETVSLADLEGRVVVLDFWATWCPPCIESLPGLQELREEYAGRPLEVFAVNTMETGDPVEFFREHGLDLPMLLEGDEVHALYAKKSIPAFVVLDGAGKHVGLGVGYYGEGSERYMRDLVEQALKATPGVY